MFNLFQDYDRAELLSFVDSKQFYSGIIWGDKEFSCVIVTSGGKGAKSAGYGDSLNQDGTRFYIGQGSKGDQNPKNFANALLANGERAILFFSTDEPTSKQVKQQGNRKKRYKYEGMYRVVSWEYVVPSAGVRSGDKLMRFLLIPASNVFSINSDIEDEVEVAEVTEFDLHKLRSKLLREHNRTKKGMQSQKEYIRRSREIVTYAKRRAHGICEYCKSKGPFLGRDYLPFLEVHHIFQLADDGPDIPSNVAALCPNCHKEAHFGLSKDEMNKIILEIIRKKNRNLMKKENVKELS